MVARIWPLGRRARFSNPPLLYSKILVMDALGEAVGGV